MELISRMRQEFHQDHFILGGQSFQVVGVTRAATNQDQKRVAAVIVTLALGADFWDEIPANQDLSFEKRMELSD
jgi:hypothetical protein